MKTLTKKAIADFKQSDSVIERLIHAVINQGLDLESMEDVVNHGIAGGFSGFFYYSETTSFYQANRDDIWELLTDQAQEMGLNELEMIAGFTSAKNAGSADQFENLLSWYAAEEVSRYCVDNYKMPQYS